MQRVGTNRLSAGALAWLVAMATSAAATLGNLAEHLPSVKGARKAIRQASRHDKRGRRMSNYGTSGVGKRECARRVRQIAAGILTASNGLEITPAR